MEWWQIELREVLGDVPDAANRMITAADEGRFTGSSFVVRCDDGTRCGCAYGVAWGYDANQAGKAAHRARDRYRYLCSELTPLERFVAPVHIGCQVGNNERLRALRAAIIDWLYEQAVHEDVEREAWQEYVDRAAAANERALQGA
jgi:hypothetical protein